MRHGTYRADSKTIQRISCARPPGPPPLAGRTLLVAHETLSDPDLGGPYALKRVRSVRQRRGGGIRIVLESINPAFAPIEIDAAEGELRVVAELVRILA